MQDTVLLIQIIAKTGGGRGIQPFVWNHGLSRTKKRGAPPGAPRRALKNPEGFFNAKEEELRAPETLRRFRAAH